MAQQIRVLAAFPGDLGLVPSIHMVAHNYLSVNYSSSRD